EAADRLREQGHAAVAKLTAAAEEKPAAVLQEAEQQAYQLRGDAWNTGIELLDLVRETSSAIIAEAEDDALLIRAEAERESHRRIVVTRKEQDDILRNARYELDRQIAIARDLAAEILETAQEEGIEVHPTPDQEMRRRELLDDIERLRALRGIEEVSVLTAEPVMGRPRDDRIRREDAGFRDFEPGLGELSDSLAAEVEQLGGKRGSAVSTAPPKAASRRHPRSDADDVGTLFEALRTTSEVEVVVGTEDRAERPGRTDRPTVDPLVVHERAVVPAHNLGLRDLKRRIVDLQAEALEALRTTGWTPEPRALLAALAPSLDQAVQRASAGGVAAARTLAGIEVGGPIGSDRARRLMSMMAQELASQLRSAAGAEGSTEEIAARMSKVFRAWRTDDIERWVSAIVDAAYHDELLAALADGGYPEVRGVSDGPPCAECPARTGAAWDPAGEPPDGARVPPAHLGCTCTIAPV
ncbi:MAG: hypothetical protein HZA58_05905, partial [Acidimicrobiia bacterium]|nr:hypothetical protein [Acidimicrobiia bacterium]